MVEGTSITEGQGASPAPDKPRAPEEGLSPRQWAAVLVLITLLAYAPAFTAGYIWDDDDYVNNNYHLRTAAGLKKIWLEPRSSPQYYPLVHTSFWLEYRLWDLWPAGYHATNVFLHAASALVLWRLLILLDLPGSWLAAAVFALHPVHVESVAWITERKNTLSLLFYLAAAFCFLKRELAPQAPGRWGLYVASLALFLAALLCKTATATFPCALLVVLWWKQGTLSVRQVALTVPMILLAVPLGLQTAWLERHHVGAIGPEWDFSLVERCLIAGRAVWFYAGKLVVPYPLIFMYPRWQIDAGDWRQFLFPISAVGLVVALLLLHKRIGRGPLAAALFFGGTLFPALGFFNVYPMKFSFVADHFQYAASIGPIVLLVCGGAWAMSRQGLAAAGPIMACLLVVALAVLAWRQCLIYQDQESLWRDTLAKNSECEMAYNNLGRWLHAEGRISEAIDVFQEAARRWPRAPEGQIGLAMAYAAVPELDRAEQILRQAIALDPKNALTYSNLASIMFKMQRMEEAESLFRQGLALEEDNVLIRLNYGTLLFKQRRFDEAQVQYERVIEQSPEAVSARFNLAALHLLRGNPTEAAQQLRLLLETDPTHADARDLLDDLLADRSNRTRPHSPSIK